MHNTNYNAVVSSMNTMILEKDDPVLLGYQ